MIDEHEEGNKEYQKIIKIKELENLNLINRLLNIMKIFNFKNGNLTLSRKNRNRWKKVVENYISN